MIYNYSNSYLLLRFALKTEQVSLHVTAELCQATLHQLDIFILLQHQQRLPCFSLKYILLNIRKLKS